MSYYHHPVKSHIYILTTRSVISNPVVKFLRVYAYTSGKSLCSGDGIILSFVPSMLNLSNPLHLAAPLRITRFGVSIQAKHFVFRAIFLPPSAAGGGAVFPSVRYLLTSELSRSEHHVHFFIMHVWGLVQIHLLVSSPSVLSLSGLTVRM